MPHLISVRDISITKRRPNLIKYLNQVKASLRDPSVTGRVREKLERQVLRIQAELKSN